MANISIGVAIVSTGATLAPEAWLDGAGTSNGGPLYSG
jgi:hypothetical protein